MRKVEHFTELREWMLAQDWSAWDAKIERDSRAGKLDSLIAEAKEESLSSRRTPPSAS